MTEKMTMKSIVSMMNAIPKRPSENGPVGMFFLPVRACGAMARAKDVELRMMNEPTRSWNAVWLPKGMAPRAVPKRAQYNVAGMGQLSFSSTREKKCANGVALSRASVHEMREQVRMVPMRV